MKPIIGIIGRPEITNEDDKVITLNEKVRQAIIKKGGIPLLIVPNQDIDYLSFSPHSVRKLTDEEKEELYSLVNICNGLLIPGGSRWYQYDEVIYNYALEKNMPTLSICAGMQMMCRIENEKENLTEYTNKEIENTTDHFKTNVKYAHKVNIVDNTKLKDIIKEETISVNSRHRYHVQVLRNLNVSAYSEDGLIEAVEYPSKDFVIGVQWHPETMLDYDEYANKIFDEFIKKAQKFDKSI